MRWHSEFAAVPPHLIGGYVYCFFRGGKASGGSGSGGGGYSGSGSGEDRQQVYAAISRDGLHWRDSDQGRPIAVSAGGDRAVRDPFLCRDADGDGFMLLGTDLDMWSMRYRAADGTIDWPSMTSRGSTAICVWRLDGAMRVVDAWLPDVAAGIGAGNVWAPRALFDEDTRRYLLYWSSATPSDRYGSQRLWACWTADFRSFDAPFLLDGDAVKVIDPCYIPLDRGLCMRFLKDEAALGVLQQVSEDGVFGPWRTIPQRLLEALRGGYEGPDAYMLPDGRVVLLVDEYTGAKRGYIALISDGLAREHGFRPLPQSEYRLPVGAKHGSVVALNAVQYALLARRV